MYKLIELIVSVCALFWVICATGLLIITTIKEIKKFLGGNK